MEEILNWLRDNKDIIYWILCLLSVFIEFKPNNKFKLWSNLFKWIGKHITSEINEEIQLLHNKLDEATRQIDEVDKNRMEDTQTILRDRITQMYHVYLNKGYILEEDKKNFNFMYDRYVKSGGNSYVRDDIEPFMSSLPRFMSDSDAQRFYEIHNNYNNGTENK